MTYEYVKWHFVFKIFLGTANVIEACSKSNVQYCVYTSSTSVVGPNANGDPFTNGNEATSYPIKPATNYDNTKLVAEEKIIKANGKVLSNGKLSILCVYTWLTLLLLVIGVIATCRYQSQKNSTEKQFDKTQTRRTVERNFGQGFKKVCRLLEKDLDHILTCKTSS